MPHRRSIRWKAPSVLATAVLGLALMSPAHAQVETPGVGTVREGSVLTSNAATAPAMPQSAGRTETYRESRPVGPGIELSTVESYGADGYTGEPGWLQTYQLSVDLTAGVEIDRLFPGRVAASRPLLDMAREAGAVAAVNADYFDISGSGAPWGVGIQDGELVQSPLPNTKATLTNETAVMFSEDAVGAIGEIVFEGTINLPGGRTVALDALNKAELLEGQIGMFTPVWGTYCRCRPVQGIDQTIEVVVRDGVVTEIVDVPRDGAIPDDGFVLVGRDAGAEALSTLGVGDPVPVDYGVRAPDDMKVKAAVSGRQLLVADGQPLELPPANNTPEPRTAVGFSNDGTRMWLVAVDGRQPEFSRGIGLNELAQMMVDLGAHSALNLDGGGSTTLVARDPGQEDAEVVNRPSDAGGARPVPTGLAMLLPEGNGSPTGFWLSTATERDRFPGPDPAASWRTERVFPGLTRSLTAAAFDETYGPADLPGNVEPQWRVDDTDTGRVSRDGVFQALSPGVTTVTAAWGRISGDIELTVLGELDRLEIDPGRISLAEAGAATTFDVNGFDSAGYAAAIDPADVTLTYDNAALEVAVEDSGAFSVTALADDGEHPITVTVGEVDTEVVVGIGTTVETVDSFDDISNWDFWGLRASGSASSTPDGYVGNGLRLDYDFTQSTQIRGVGIWPADDLLPVAGEPTAFKIWVHSEGHVHRTRLEVVDRNGQLHTIEPGFVTAPGWQEVTYEVPGNVAYPVSLRRIFFNELDPGATYVGTLIVDELTAVVPS